MVGNGAEASDGDGGYPRVAAFRDVMVVPFVSLMSLSGGSAHKGGPIWPDWEGSGFEHLHGFGRIFDDRPDNAEAEETAGEGPHWWIGPIYEHYGHAIADFTQRIRPTLEACPQARLVFSGMAGASFRVADDLPPYYRAIAEWHGVGPERLVVVSRPTVFRELHVAAQPETSGEDSRAAPHPGHLDALTALTRDRLGAPEREGVLFVSRSSQRNGFAGEGFLDEAFAAAGAEVLLPETLPLREQIARYAGARRLVFSEGSAAHTLQLGGRNFGAVTLLKRRDWPSRFAAGLGPRCESYEEIDAARGFVSGLLPTGDPNHGAGISLLDTGALHAAMARIGLDLAAVWNAERFAAAEAADLRRWLRGAGRMALEAHPGSLRAILGALGRSGARGARREAALLAARGAWGAMPAPLRGALRRMRGR